MLVVPLPSAESHTFVMVKVAQEMAARGHEILVSCLGYEQCFREGHGLLPSQMHDAMKHV